MSLVIKRTLRDHITDAVIALVLILLALSIIIPFWILLVRSVNASVAGSSGMYLWPQNFTWNNYKMVAENRFVWLGYKNTIIRTVLGTVMSLMMTSIGAYCLSRKQFPMRTFWSMFVVITMFVGGGMIPSYLLINSLGLIDSMMALILPGLISTYNMVIMRNFFQQLPAEIEESGRIDGANNLVVLVRLIMPISKPVMATIAMWIAVGHWNAWFDCLIYIRSVEKFVVQIVLRRIVLEGTLQMMDSAQAQADYQLNPEGMKSAIIFFTTLPILAIYPFVQKYFTQGIMLGSLKG